MTVRSARKPLQLLLQIYINLSCSVNLCAIIMKQVCISFYTQITIILETESYHDPTAKLSNIVVCTVMRKSIKSQDLGMRYPFFMLYLSNKLLTKP